MQFRFALSRDHTRNTKNEWTIKLLIGLGEGWEELHGFFLLLFFLSYLVILVEFCFICRISFFKLLKPSQYARMAMHNFDISTAHNSTSILVVSHTVSFRTEVTQSHAKKLKKTSTIFIALLLTAKRLFVK